MNSAMRSNGMIRCGSVLAGLLVTMVFVSCSLLDDPTQPRFANEVSQILGGEETTGYPEVVALYGRNPDEEAGALCTATVIAPRVVLTAAHCVDPEVTGEGLEYKIMTGHQLLDEPCPCYEVAETHFHPNFSSSNLTNGYDIAVVITKEPLPISPAAYMKRPMTDDLTGKEVTLVGYGLDNAWEETGAGTKRVVFTPLNSFDDKLVKTGDSSTGICSGDSGGPVFMDINGVPTVVGVNSYGFMYCLFEGNSTRVDAYRDFIEQFLDECEPLTCRELGIVCGPASDGCGGTLDCGGCPDGQSCHDGQCAEGPACADGEVHCAGDVVQVCEGGDWVDSVDCSDNHLVCENGQCVGDSFCGDGVCDGMENGEDCDSCPDDCPSVDMWIFKLACCGDGECSEYFESEDICPVDCQ